MTARSFVLAAAAGAGLLLAAGLSVAGGPDAPQGMGGMSGMGGMGGMGMGPGGMWMDMGPGMRMGMGPGGMGFMGDCPMMGGMHGMGGMGGMGMGGMGGMMGMSADLRVDLVRSELAITEAQKAVFDAYVDALGKHHARIRAMHETMKETRNTGTAPERLDRRASAMEQHAAALKELKAPLTTLYDALTPEQKAKADGLLGGGGCMP